MSSNDKKKNWSVKTTPDHPLKQSWVGSYDEYSPNGYSLQDEFGWTSEDTVEMYADAVRGLRAQINAKKEQKKSDVDTKDI